MKTRKLLKLAYAAQALGRDAFSDLGRLHDDHVRHRVRSQLAHVRHHVRAARRSRAGRNPFLMAFGGVFLGLVAFVLVMMALGAVFALLGLMLKVALVVGAVYLAVRFMRGRRRLGTEVMIVPPEYRSPTTRYRS